MGTKDYAIHSLGQGDLTNAAKICARAMLDNPVHIRVFGNSIKLRQQRLDRFFRGLLPYVHHKGEILGLYAEGDLAGVMGILPPNHCKPSFGDLLKLLPTLLTSNSPVGVLRIAVWLGTWARIDPHTPHWHLGPLAVKQEWQRHGIGTQLMEHVCREASNTNLYLETDKSANVEFYKKLGFIITAEPVILQTPSWVMMRT